MTYPPQPPPGRYGDPGGYGQAYPGQQYPAQPEYQGQPSGQPEYQAQPYGQPGYQGQPGYPGQYYQGQPEYQGQYPQPEYAGQPYQQQPYQGQPYQGQYGWYGQPQQEAYFGGGYAGQQPGYGMPPGGYSPPQPPEPPERKSKAGLIVGVTLVVLLLAAGAVGVTGFWAPGYFLGDDSGTEESAAASTGSGSGPAPSTATQPETAPPKPTTTVRPAPSGNDEAEIRRITDAVVAGINGRDASMVKPVSCDPSKERQSDYDNFPDDLTVSATGDPAISGDAAQVPLVLTRSGNSKNANLELRRVDGSWCASGVT